MKNVMNVDNIMLFFNPMNERHVIEVTSKGERLNAIERVEAKKFKVGEKLNNTDEIVKMINIINYVLVEIIFESGRIDLYGNRPYYIEYKKSNE